MEVYDARELDALLECLVEPVSKLAEDVAIADVSVVETWRVNKVELARADVGPETANVAGAFFLISYRGWRSGKNQRT